MKYILIWTIKPEDRQESMDRWKKKGVKPPKGIKILGHYSNVNHLGGWAIIESSDHKAIATWLMDWTDLNVNEVIPIIDSNNLEDVVGCNPMSS